jgi:thiol-disulfide isomerase/thioredoxin
VTSRRFAARPAAVAPLAVARLVPALLALALLAVVLLAGCGTTGTADAPAPPRFAGSGFAPCPAPVGAPLTSGGLPAKALECMDGSGTRTRLDRGTGVPTVVNLWAPWCGPCATELPAFGRLHADAAGRLTVLGVVTAADPAQSVDAAKDLHLTFPNVYDRDEVVLRGVGERALPVTVFVGADGRVREVYKGGALTDRALRALVRTHLGVDVR